MMLEVGEWKFEFTSPLRGFVKHWQSQFQIPFSRFQFPIFGNRNFINQEISKTMKMKDYENEKPRVVVHNGPFHVDDVFAVATFDLFFEGRYELIRTRDEGVIETADYVMDVGGVYDEKKNRFDHHQEGGAGERSGVPYSSIGLVWKKFGADICGSEEVAREVEKKFILAVDAMDNGVDVIPKNHLGIHIAHLHDVIKSYQPAWNSERDFDEGFCEALLFAKGFLSRTIAKTKSSLLAEEKVRRVYEDTEDKRIIVFDCYYPTNEILLEYPEPLYMIYPGEGGHQWYLKACKAERDTFENRRDLPKDWGGKRDGELAEITGVSDARFCHNALWIASAGSKEGAIKLAQIAVEESRA